MKRLTLLLTLTTLVSVLAFSDAANANWGPKGECNSEGAHHCYAIEQWDMKGYPTEYGVGAALQMYTETINVTEYTQPRDFVSQEEWVGFGERVWIETGGIAGPQGCCTLHRFYASWGKPHETEYNYYESPEVLPGDVNNDYEIWDPSHTGEYWGIWWGAEANGAGTLMVHDYGYPAYNKEVEVGQEISQPNSKPYASGRDEIASVEPPNNNWTELLSGYGNHSHEFLDGGMCEARNPYSPHWGNIYFTTCQPPGAEVKSEASGTVATSAVTSDTQAEQIALRYAAEQNDGEPTNVEEASVARGSFAGAQGIVSPEAAVTSNSQSQQWLASPTYLVVMHGHFRVAGLPLPQGSATPSGTVEGLVIDRETGHVEGVHLAEAGPSSRELEAVPLPGQTGGPASGPPLAQAASVHAGITGVAVEGASKPGPAGPGAPAIGAEIEAVRGGVVVAHTHPNKTGHFSLQVRPGTYEVRGRWQGRTCSTPAEKTRVEHARITKVRVECGGKGSKPAA